MACVSEPVSGDPARAEVYKTLRKAFEIEGVHGYAVNLPDGVKAYVEPILGERFPLAYCVDEDCVGETAASRAMLVRSIPQRLGGNVSQPSSLLGAILCNYVQVFIGAQVDADDLWHSSVAHRLMIASGLTELRMQSDPVAQQCLSEAMRLILTDEEPSRARMVSVVRENIMMQVTRQRPA
ncbi:hypothetical protein JCM10908_004790 [Rhodotorula pacifica]|uniref:uncharacterized protein n=1 Tax=Rhodotorula pacifica TaxID=1495444 RepID=UPI0031704E2D